MTFQISVRAIYYSMKKFPLITCNRCSYCCREPLVPVTHKDVKRILKFTKLKVNEIVRFYSPKEMEYDKDSDMWIRFTYGKRALGLKKRDGHCIFLDESNNCTVYKTRPMTCRTFPYEVYLDDNGSVESAAQNEVLTCAATVSKTDTFDDIIRMVKKENDEDDDFFDLIYDWNHREEKGSSKDFLEFVGLL